MRYYVYELINSIDGTVIYVGKGTRYRMYIHVRRAKKNDTQHSKNPKLLNKIRSIIDNGGTILYNVIYRTDDDIDAYAKETDRINELGISNLCNIKIGQMCIEDIYELNRKRMLGKTLKDETKQKISKSLKGHQVTEVTREKLRQYNKGVVRPPRKRPFPKILDSKGNVHTIYKLKDFCKQHNIHTSTMSALLCGRRKRLRSGGWTLFIEM